MGYEKWNSNVNCLNNRSSINSCIVEEWACSKWSLWSDQSNWTSIWVNSSFGPSLLEVESGQLSESPLVWNDNFLSSWEFVLGSSEGFQGWFNVLFIKSNWVQNWSNFNSGDFSIRFTEGLSHTGLVYQLQHMTTSYWFWGRAMGELCISSGSYLFQRV